MKVLLKLIMATCLGLILGVGIQMLVGCGSTDLELKASTCGSNCTVDELNEMGRKIAGADEAVGRQYHDAKDHLGRKSNDAREYFYTRGICEARHGDNCDGGAADGSDGSEGTDGGVGSQGTAGTDGNNGSAGDDGAAGADGETGAAGTDGSDGSDGDGSDGDGSDGDGSDGDGAGIVTTFSIHSPIIS